MTIEIFAWKPSDDSRPFFQNIFQPPTDVANKIVSLFLAGNLEAALQKYKDWVIESNKVSDVEVFETGTGFDDGGGSLGYPHITEKYNVGEEHCRQLNSWIEFYRKQGYDIGVRTC
jgi:hypothetical protein